MDDVPLLAPPVTLPLLAGSKQEFVAITPTHSSDVQEVPWGRACFVWQSATTLQRAKGAKRAFALAQWEKRKPVIG